LRIGGDIRLFSPAGGLGVRLDHRRLHAERVFVDLALQIGSLETRAHQAPGRCLKKDINLKDINMRSREVHLVERPQGLPVPAQFRVVETAMADPAEGQLLVENIYMSVDPAMRPRLAGPTALNEAMMGGAIGRVLESRNA